MIVGAVYFAVSLATMYAAHDIADHVLAQTDKMAANKVKSGIEGWTAILQHVGLYHIVMAIMLIVTFLALGLSIPVWGFIAAISFSFITHAVIDRRWPVRILLEKIGSPGFAKMLSPICGMYQADQSIHKTCLWISALLLAMCAIWL